MKNNHNNTRQAKGKGTLSPILYPLLLFTFYFLLFLPSCSSPSGKVLPDNPQLLWEYRGAVRTKSSPVVSGETTYWCDRKGKISGVNARGELVFSHDLQTAVESSVLVEDSVLYLGRIDGFITAISIATGEIIWNVETMGQVVASPNLLTIEGQKRIVIGSYDNELYILDATTGAKISSVPTGNYINGTAALWQHYAIFGGCDHWLRMVDCRTGIQADSLLLGSYIPSSPTIVENQCFIGDNSGNIYQIEIHDGRFQQHQQLTAVDNAQGSFESVPAVSEEAYYYYSGEKHLVAHSRTDHRQLWQHLLKGFTDESSPLVCAHKLIACTKTGIISILDAHTGDLLWEYDCGEQIIGTPAVISGRFFILTAKGTLLCFGE
ncbi:MAG: PQQ-binding-like beta-propeller repeat protein [Mangrovibacterium sp.]